MQQQDYLTHYGVIEIKGPDAAKFLQGQITCNVVDWPDQINQLAAHCNPQGRIISEFFISRADGGFLLILPHEMTTIAIAQLKKYAVFFKLQIDDLSHAFFPVANYDCDHLLATLAFNLQSRDCAQHTKAQFDNELINNKIPMVQAVTSGKLLPHDIGLVDLGAVDFNKGCYTGQEIIARMHYKAKLKYRLYLASIPALNSLNHENNKICSTVIHTPTEPAPDLIRGNPTIYPGLNILNHENNRICGTIINTAVGRISEQGERYPTIHHEKESNNLLLLISADQQYINHKLYIENHPKYSFSLV